MPDDTTARPLSEEELRELRIKETRPELYALTAYPNPSTPYAVRRLLATIAQRDADFRELQRKFELLGENLDAARKEMGRCWGEVADRDALIEKLRARVKELEDRVTSWEQDALRGSTGLAAWDWG